MKTYKLDMMRFNRDLKQAQVTLDDEPDKPKMHMIIMDEFTPEALYDQLEDNDAGIMVWKDELKGMFIKNEKTDVLRTKLISAWSGQNITRNTKTQGVNILIDPYVRVGGNVQPEVVKQILSDNKSGFNADGFIVRFQMIAHLKKNGFTWNPNTDSFAKEEFISICKRVYKQKEEKVLIFDKEGERTVEKFMRSVDKDVNDAASNFEKEYLSKLGSLFGSIMVIIHQLTEKKKECVVSSETIRMAMNITNTATNNAFHLFDIERRENIQNANAENVIETWVETYGKKTFKSHDGEMTLSRVKDYLNGRVTTIQLQEFFENDDDYEVVKSGRGSKVKRL
jgi:hypothetical protein